MACEPVITPLSTGYACRSPIRAVCKAALEFPRFLMRVKSTIAVSQDNGGIHFDEVRDDDNP
jgi:hypothetical protein